MKVKCVKCGLLIGESIVTHMGITCARCLGKSMTAKVDVAGITFIVDNEIERYRAETLLTKEPGTIAWLDQLQPGDIFYDIGANIGCYTLYAAKRGATVYAFEPHVGNAWKLLQNVEENKLRDRVGVVCCAVDSYKKILNFNYTSLASGMSGSQFGHHTGENGKAFRVAAQELKPAFALDDFIYIPAPDLLKIDVDGNEDAVLMGATEKIKNCKSIQVELRAGLMAEGILFSEGFTLAKRHYTANGKQQLAAGVPTEQITYNGVFERV